MTDLIKHGYIYIAQPPLYKVKKGKKEIYVETEKEMDNILIDFATENAKMKISYDSKYIEIVEEKVREILSLSKNLNELIRTIENKGIKFKNLIDYYQQNKKIPQYYLVDNVDKKEYYFDNYKQLSEFLGKKDEEIDLFSDEKSNYKIVEIYEKGQLEKILEKIKEFKIAPSEIFNKCFILINEEEERYSLIEIFEALKEKGKKNLFIQRYKGLGEMNPLQLWETTMSPERRTLKKVTIEDAIKAEEIFTTLMGDAVEPRKEFIEKFAKEVKNLDI